MNSTKARFNSPFRLPVYMDHHATTPVDPRVLDAMIPIFSDCFGNAASIDHHYGVDAARCVQVAREHIARIIGAESEEIIFTSGATEADNLALIGIAEKMVGQGNHIITARTEHKAILDSCRYLESRGFRVTYLPVDQFGLLDPDDVRRAILPETILVSAMAANNEIGTIAPVADIGKITRERGILFHTDATQAVGHVPIDVDAMNIDLLSMSAHKIYGPKGVGALYVRRHRPRVQLAPQIHGGGHERGLRSGTLNVPGIVGFGKALEIARQEMTTESGRLRGLRDHLWEIIQANLEDVHLNGHPVQRLPHSLSVAFQGVEGRSLLVQLKDHVAVSIGSACTTVVVEPSHVILAMGFDEERAHSTLRFSLGRQNTKPEIEYVAAHVVESVERMRRLLRS